MIYEFIATISAGFGMAGIAMIIRRLTKLMGKQTPKWLIPIFAGLGMLGFQIHQEYHWHEQQMTNMPNDAYVLKVVEGTAWYRPWSYLKPQVIRFMAVDSGKPISSSLLNASNEQLSQVESNPDQSNPVQINLAQPNLDKDTIKQANIYLYERRISTKIIPQLVNCTYPAIASLPSPSSSDSTDTIDEPLNWQQLPLDDDIIKHVCNQ